ncbi:TPA: cardiolipin synthase [Streptococcus suis]|uniref:cardiolipin synthase n=1 Tax=Streptococcus parasuis TaxID=1501662 RepID=UPI002412CCE6|nr:cardiolipin synthase [Streptococcus parasuis]MDG4478638.1 cardiolipin synthase [Streptococcus parasuis]
MEKIWKIIYSRTFIVLSLIALTIFVILWTVGSAATYFPAFLTVMQLFSLVVAVSIINRPMNASFKLTWIVFVVGIPVFGALFYFILQSNIETRRYRKTFQRQAEILRLYGKTSEKVMRGLAKEDREQLKLAHYMSEYVGYPLHTNTDAVYFPSGEAKFEALVEELKKAENYIFMEYFIVDFGYMWDSILDILKEKAAQGVEVRFMYDGMNSLSTLPYNYYKTLRQIGIKTKVFSQIIPALSTIQNNRDHRKIAVIDGKVAFTGGVNIADEYINKKERFGYWKDAAIMIRGEAVSNFTLMFLQMWNHDEKKSNDDLKYLKEAHDAETETTDTEGYFLAYGESPFDGDEVAKRVYLDMIQSATDYIYIMTPYLVLDDEMIDNLTYAAKRGVTVRILLPHIYDKQTAYLAARTDFRTYLESGIEIYEFTPGFVHSKVVLVDDKKATVGTVNMDFRSFYLNFECGLYVYNHRQVLEDIHKDFMHSFEQSERITFLGFENNYPWYKRLAGALLNILSPLL